LAVSLTGGNRNDVTQLMPLIEKVPSVRGRRGRPRKRPDALCADQGYDHDKYRRLVRDKGITPMIARRGVEHGSGPDVHRWVVEQSFALLHWFRRMPCCRAIVRCRRSASHQLAGVRSGQRSHVAKSSPGL
jgi:transposase